MNEDQERGEVSEDLDGSRIQDGHRRLYDKRRNRSGGRVGVEISVQGNEKEHLRLFIYLLQYDPTGMATNIGWHRLCGDKVLGRRPF